MFLEDLCRAFVSARRDDRATKERVAKEARRLLSTATSDDWESLTEALGDDQRKWFIAAIFAESPVPKRMLKAMIRAAIYEANPSLNREFITSCIASFGHRIVNEALLDIVETGSDFEKAGAVNASYWGGMSLSFPANTKPSRWKTPGPNLVLLFLNSKTCGNEDAASFFVNSCRTRMSMYGKALFRA